MRPSGFFSYFVLWAWLWTSGFAGTPDASYWLAPASSVDSRARSAGKAPRARSPGIFRNGEHWEVWKQNRPYRFDDLWDVARASFHELESLVSERRFCREALESIRAEKAKAPGDTVWPRPVLSLFEKTKERPDPRWAEDKRAVWDALQALRGEGTGPIDDRLKRLESALGEYARRLDRMIGAIRRKRHREALEETAKLAGRVLFRIQRIRSSVRANRIHAARAELFGLSRWKVLKGEPLYAEVPGLCHAAAQALFRRDKERTESWIEVLEQRAVFARRWPRILERFTDFWLDAPPGNRVLHERIAPFFERVVSGLPEYSGPRRVRERAALWALTIQWFRISRRDEPERGESAAFRAASAYRRILGYPDISGLFAASWFGSKRYRFARTYLGELRRETLLREDLEGLARALAEDFRLDSETASLLLECVRVEPRPGNLADQAAGAYKTSRRAA